MFERNVTVLPSQASCRGEIKLRSLLDLFQDTAEMAVMNLEGSSMELMAKGYAWILRRYEINFLGALPMLDEPFTIKTFHDPSHGHNMLRVFDVTRPAPDSEENVPFVWAKTGWLLMDLATGRAVRALEHIPDIGSANTGDISADFREPPRESSVTSLGETIPWQARWHDLDLNGHVNNAAYFEWLVEATIMLNPDAVNWALSSVAATFRSGVKFGDRVDIQVNELPSEASENANASRERTFVYRVLIKSDENATPKAGPVFVATWRTGAYS